MIDLKKIKFFIMILLAPSFEEAMNMPRSEDYGNMQQPASGNIGWNLNKPSAPEAF